MISRLLPLAVALLLASCVSIERNNPDDPGSPNYQGRGGGELISSSSGGAVPSSASVSPCADFNGATREHYGREKDQFCDSRDGKRYVFVRIYNQFWMAENLNYSSGGSVCYGSLTENCDIYGRLYNWATATTICPSGWHLPSQEEWGTLINFVGGQSTASAKLKAASGWNEGNGEDEFGFAGLPGGGYYNNFSGIGTVGTWWSATADGDMPRAWHYGMVADAQLQIVSYMMSAYRSVRCIRN